MSKKVAKTVALRTKGAKVQGIPTSPHLVLNNTAPRFLEDSQFDKLVEGTELWFHALVECGRTIGWRLRELQYLRVEHVDIVNRTIRLDPATTMSEYERKVYMPDAVLALISQCVKGKDGTDFVFTHRTGRPVLSIQRIWQAQCVRAGLGEFICPECQQVNAINPHSLRMTCLVCGYKGGRRYRGLVFHDLRRAAALRLRRAGASETLVMKILGFSPSRLVQRFEILNPAALSGSALDEQIEFYKRSTPR